MQKKLKIGLIGCGPRSIAAVNFNNIENCKVVAVCDKIENLAKLRAKSLNLDMEKAVVLDHRELLKDKEIDAVYVCVEPENNAKLVCESLESGKDTYCDVPLALTMEECWEIVVAVERSKRKFILGEQTRFAPMTEAWTKMVRDGRLGKILYASGQYLHGMGNDRYYLDSITGERLDYRKIENNSNSVKSRMWKLEHPIHYLPHELSPLLRVINDRVTRVSCIGTRKQSYVHEWFTMSDMEVALMQTENDVILRMAAGFTVDTMKTAQNTHWKHIMGTLGCVEQGRDSVPHSGLFFASNENMNPAFPAKMVWDFNSLNTSKEAISSGHGGIDFSSFLSFIKYLREEETNGLLTVYKAVETAAPAILAGISAERNGEWLDVPDFRPGPNREKGKTPKDIYKGI